MKENYPIPKWVTNYHKNFMLKERTKCFKTCLKCGEIKLIFKFSLDKRNLDGRTNICKACRVLEAEKYYYKNKERLKKRASKWYLENKEAIKERNLKYYQVNKEACRQNRKLWIEKNKERIKKYNRQYKRKHKILKAV